MNCASALISTLYQDALNDANSKTIRLTDALEITFGAAFSSKYFNEDGSGYPLIRIRDLKTHAPQIWTTERLPRDLVVQPGDTVAGMDAEFRPSFWLGSPALLNQRVFHARSRVGGGSAFAREVLRDPLAEIEGFKTGTTVAHLNKSDLESIEVKIPANIALDDFASKAEPLHLRIVASAQESRTLAELRDTLLPKLISGEIRVRDAERCVEDAV